MPLVGLAMVPVFAAIAHGQNSDGAQNPLVGTWNLSLDWGNGGTMNEQIVTVNSDLTGTIEDISEGWETEVRDIALNGDALSFNFFFEDRNDLKADFTGTVIGNEIKGVYTIVSVNAVVAGVRLSGEEAARIAAQPSVSDLYEARTFTGSKDDTLQYRLFIPEDYDPKKKYPLVLFHHGRGGIGNDNKRQLEGACSREWILPDAQANNPCFIVAP